ncbi:MAG: hypothetical protein HN704_06235 [Bacteroidetes bacterium]|jgi:hypothetical protein|nr:hypothetical protein [Bacteroidota bacterium]MBT6685106.1 hypothetical protein [Bacteroidota bacterium]MBT7141929.1 hypothetical protein [Bacteroidota bacterium]MBT7491186.1 hypothetical protein [Bacteroidota bacterium]
MNRHLNLYNFFNNHEKEYIEDNLSRAFAISLKYDNQFLDNVLKYLLPEYIYSDLFNTDQPNYKLEIDIQKDTNQLEGFDNIIAIACSGTEIVDFNKYNTRTTNNPITDVCIEINNTCLIFEFKRTNEDPASQLKGQAEKIKELSESDNEIVYFDFNWKKIIKLLLNVLSFQKQINQENAFTKDFVEFLENKHPYWFPHRLLKNIIYTRNENNPNFYYLGRRLNEIKDQVYGSEFTKSIGTKYNRYIISKNFGWANEFHIGYTERENQINISVYPGDTKSQGWHFFKPNKQIFFPERINKYPTYTKYYLKFSHFNSGLFWLMPNENEVKRTHTYDFFKRFAGRWKKHKWEKFKLELDIYIPNWINNCDWNSQFENTNRSYFDLSIGTYLAVYIPYDKAKETDNDFLHSNLANEIKTVIETIEKIVNK